MQHALFVVDDDLWGTEIQEALEAVVAVDHPAVEVVEVAGGEAATVELHHGAQLRWDHRHDVEDHRLRVVAAAPLGIALVERGDDLQPLDGLLAPLGAERLATAGHMVDGAAELDLFLVEVDAVDERLDRVGASATLEVVAVAVAQLAPQEFVVDDQPRVETLEVVPGAGEQVELHLVALADAGHFLFGSGLHLARVGPFSLGAHGVVFELLVAPVDSHFELLAQLVALGQVLGLEARQVRVALLLIDPGDQIGGEVDDLLQLLGLELFLGLEAGEQVGQPATGTAQVPDVHDGGGEGDVAHALATHLGAGDLDPTALTDDALEAHPLVLAAVALPVAGGPEDLLAEQAVLLGTQGAVVERLGLLHFLLTRVPLVGPGADLVGRGQTDLQLVEHVYVEHFVFAFLSSRSCGRPCGPHARGRPRRCRAHCG